MKLKKSTIAAAVTAGGVFLATGAGALTLPGTANEDATKNVPEAVELPDVEAGSAADDVRKNAKDQKTTTEDTEVKDEATTESTENENENEKDDEGDGEGSRPTDTHGYTISSLATSTEGGPEKGEIISTEARKNGKAGEAGPAEGERGQSADHRPED